MRAAVDCQPGQSHSVGHGKRVRGGDTCRGFARVTGKQEVIPSNPSGNWRLVPVVQKGSYAAAASG
jgi:hypothetical protein